jgi:hypothetical protein
MFISLIHVFLVNADSVNPVFERVLLIPDVLKKLPQISTYIELLVVQKDGEALLGVSPGVGKGGIVIFQS